MLPDLNVYFYDDLSDRAGHYRLFQQSVTPAKASICSELDFLMRHGLAHAFNAADLDEQSKANYAKARGFANRNDPDADWHERRVEDAAFVMRPNRTS